MGVSPLSKTLAVELIGEYGEGRKRDIHSSLTFMVQDIAQRFGALSTIIESIVK